jgi:undecaprenyl-diphosphatase
MGLWLADANGHSFPSGHTTTSALVAALLCTALARRFGGRRRLALQLVCVAWAVAVGLTRVYLAVHWMTDVLGGWLLAGGLTLLTSAVVLARRPDQRMLPV